MHHKGLGDSDKGLDRRPAQRRHHYWNDEEANIIDKYLWLQKNKIILIAQAFQQQQNLRGGLKFSITCDNFCRRAPVSAGSAK